MRVERFGVEKLKIDTFSPRPAVPLSPFWKRGVSRKSGGWALFTRLSCCHFFCQSVCWVSLGRSLDKAIKCDDVLWSDPILLFRERYRERYRSLFSWDLKGGRRQKGHGKGSIKNFHPSKGWNIITIYSDVFFSPIWDSPTKQLELW